MSTDSIRPLKVKSQLASNPSKKPIYSVTAKLASGESYEFADPTATRALISLMDMQAVLGGAASHFGGPSAFAELMSAMYGIAFSEGEKSGKQWFECMHLINDAGHCENGIYALKANYNFADLNIASLKGFRSIESQLTGHGEAHIFPEGVYLSNGPLGSSLPQAQGLAYADALAGNKERVTVTAISDGACMEGEAKEAMAAIPGFAAKGNMAPFVMVVSDNNTKLSGRIAEESFSMQPTFESLKDLGWKVITLEKAHDLQECISILEQAVNEARNNPNQPIAIHAKTIKGYGTEKTEKSSSGAHGFPLKSPTELPEFLSEIYNGQEVPSEFTAWIDEMVEQEKNKKAQASTDSVKKEKVQVGISKAMIGARKKGFPILSVSSDLPGSTGVKGFQGEFPEATIDVGIAESNMVSMAAGLSKEGFIPVVDTFSQFGVTKGALPFLMASLSEAPVIAVFSHAGFQDAADGASHQALSYFSMTHSIPHLKTYCLTSSSEAYALMSQAIEEFANKRSKGETPDSVIFFLGRENFPQSYLADESSYKLGHAQMVFEGVKDENGAATVVAAGPLLHQALDAAMELEKEGIHINVINPSCINDPDIALIRTSLRNTGNRLVTVEDHQLVGGMGAVIVHALAQEGACPKVTSLGVNGEFGQSAYKAVELYQKHNIDKEAIIKACR